MNNQLQQLEHRVAQMVERFNALIAEKHSLQQELTQLQSKQQQMMEDFVQEREKICKQYELDQLRLEENLHKEIATLTADNEHYKSVISQTATDLNTLLDRLPTQDKEAS